MMLAHLLVPSPKSEDPRSSRRAASAMTARDRFLCAKARTSQFEQHVRAIAGWPLGATDRHGAKENSYIEMENLIGAEVLNWAKILSEPSAKLHLYGKAEARPGRKMGHVTRTVAGPDP